MSARTATRRNLRSAAATAVVAAVAGTVLMPLSAYAAPAEAGNQHALKITVGAPAPSGPLTRGGATETFELTVANPSDKAHSFHPWMIGTPAGASPLQKADVTFKVEGVTAPATESSIGQQDGEWQGMFHPAGKEASEGFEIPAGGKLTWKVTVGLNKSYPTNDGDFQLRATSYRNEVAEGGDASLTFKSDPAVKAGKLETSFKNIGDCKGVPALQCREMDLSYRVTGDGEFGTALYSWLDLSFGSQVNVPNLQLWTQVDGKWEALSTADPYHFMLPTIPKGFSAASGERVLHLRASFGPNTDFKKATDVTLHAGVSLPEGNTYEFAGADTKFQLTPPTATTSPSPSPTPSKSATAQPSASASPSASATTATAGGTNSNTKATGSTGTLAKTGAGSDTGLYAGLAATLVVLGGAAAWLGARRRRATRV
ncbi:LPXTG cell wall anchor domain-containing protein [Streptomyces sp. NBC_00320]|uniref:LPXTG cell wall anchor domain-containing protein n=1 Tax=unclassified Streptomyces TaxID=2593676 RepID=UPI00224CB60C|nr:LPXTG cell wall anchor domain-containing protein [Streptomyces sp. NBC_00320]MCX5147062.1 LPXTG cell wall anchor domain-containing protein [Streptomyces sp. NBC_00320]WSW60332.1 LPXTG cell wall anchor domain-containing protein [Streptomyces sp. NBC_00998]